MVTHKCCILISASPEGQALFWTIAEGHQTHGGQSVALAVLCTMQKEEAANAGQVNSYSPIILC